MNYSVETYGCKILWLKFRVLIKGSWIDDMELTKEHMDLQLNYIQLLLKFGANLEVKDQRSQWAGLIQVEWLRISFSLFLI